LRKIAKSKKFAKFRATKVPVRVLASEERERERERESKTSVTLSQL